MAYLIVINMIFLNLFVAVIVESFISQQQAIDLPVQNYDLDIFINCWKDFDTDAVGHIFCH